MAAEGDEIGFGGVVPAGLGGYFTKEWADDEERRELTGVALLLALRLLSHTHSI